jgi:hypothetical protein
VVVTVIVAVGAARTDNPNLATSTLHNKRNTRNRMSRMVASLDM